MLLKNIKDIVLEGNTISIIREKIIEVKSIEEQVAKLGCSAANLAKVDEVENLKLPPFAQVFFYLFFQKLSVPGEKEFVEEYLKWLESDESWGNKQIDKEGLENRILRTYPSLIRDLHFFFLANNSGRFSKVHYSLSRDWRDGIDFEITYGNESYYVSLYFETKRAKDFKEKKYRRHEYDRKKEIVLALNTGNLKTVGSIFLTTDYHLDFIENEIKKRIKDKGAGSPV